MRKQEKRRRYVNTLRNSPYSNANLSGTELATERRPREIAGNALRRRHFRSLLFIRMFTADSPISCSILDGPFNTIFSISLTSLAVARCDCVSVLFLTSRSDITVIRFQVVMIGGFVLLNIKSVVYGQGRPVRLLIIKLLDLRCFMISCNLYLRKLFYRWLLLLLNPLFSTCLELGL